MFDETHDTTNAETGGSRRSAAGQLRTQLPQQSAPVRRGKHPEGYLSGGGEASSWLGSIGQSIDDLFPF
ncbi:hypothetical protein [Streptomyces sp. NPDC090025]|uniref:hypothetical protein n=1 Tax=Streptomyces sp. NPDC090025 TaxID=3365922 RepID=UPI00383525CB